MCIRMAKKIKLFDIRRFKAAIDFIPRMEKKTQKVVKRNRY